MHPTDPPSPHLLLLLFPTLLPGLNEVTVLHACIYFNKRSNSGLHPLGAGAALWGASPRGPPSGRTACHSPPPGPRPAALQGEIVPATRERLLDLFYGVNRKDTDAVRIMWCAAF